MSSCKICDTFKDTFFFEEYLRWLFLTVLNIIFGNKSSFEFRAIVKISKLLSQVSWRSKIKYFVTVLSEKKIVNIFHDAYFVHGTRKKFHKNMFLNCCCNQFTNYISFYPNTFQSFSTLVGKYWSINPITSGIHKMVKHTLKNYWRFDVGDEWIQRCV